MKISNISACKNKNLQKKNPLKETKNPSRYHNSITNLKFLTQDKISFFKKKSAYKNRPTTTT
jgi:hypothetical protein